MRRPAWSWSYLAIPAVILCAFIIGLSTPRLGVNPPPPPGYPNSPLPPHSDFGPRPLFAQIPATTRGTWTCSLDNIAATLTQCLAAPSGDLRAWLTTVVAQSTTATAGQFLLRTGTGTNCGTGTASFFPDTATVIRFAAPGNTGAPLVVDLNTALPAPVASAICVLGVATNTVTIVLTGYYSP